MPLAGPSVRIEDGAAVGEAGAGGGRGGVGGEAPEGGARGRRGSLRGRGRGGGAEEGGGEDDGGEEYPLVTITILLGSEQGGRHRNIFSLRLKLFCSASRDSLGNRHIVVSEY